MLEWFLQRREERGLRPRRGFEPALAVCMLVGTAAAAVVVLAVATLVIFPFGRNPMGSDSNDGLALGVWFAAWIAIWAIVAAERRPRWLIPALVAGFAVATVALALTSPPIG